MGKCLDWGEAGAAATAGAVGGFLVWGGACGVAETAALATKMTRPKKSNRVRKGMRVDKSSGLEDTPRQVSGTNAELAEEFLVLWTSPSTKQRRPSTRKLL